MNKKADIYVIEWVVQTHILLQRYFCQITNIRLFLLKNFLFQYVLLYILFIFSSKYSNEN